MARTRITRDAETGRESITVFFTLSMIRRHLILLGHGYKISEIQEALNILSGTMIEIWPEVDEESCDDKQAKRRELQSAVCAWEIPFSRTTRPAGRATGRQQSEREPLPLGRAPVGAGYAECANSRHQVEIAESEFEKQQRQTNEEGTVWLHRRQIPNPCATDAERQQHEQPNTAYRRANLVQQCDVGDGSAVCPIINVLARE